MSIARSIASELAGQDLIEMSDTLYPMGVESDELLVVVGLLLGIFIFLLCILVLYSVKQNQSKAEKAKIELTKKLEDLSRAFKLENARCSKDISDFKTEFYNRLRQESTIVERTLRTEWTEKIEMIKQEIESIKNEKLENLSRTFTSENEKRAKEISNFKTEFDHRLRMESASVERTLRIEWMEKLEMIEQQIERIENEKLADLSRIFNSENEKRAKEISNFKSEFDHRLRVELASVEEKLLEYIFFRLGWAIVKYKLDCCRGSEWSRGLPQTGLQRALETILSDSRSGVYSKYQQFYSNNESDDSD